MWSILRLVFSANYWRMMARWETWRVGLVALRRLHKDKRAWKHVRHLLFLISAPFLAPLCALLILTPGGLIGTFIAMGRSPERRRKAASEAALKAASGLPPPPPTAELRREMAELALLHAVLADRAGSESFVRNKVLPEGIEVITRRRHLQILRDHGLYERLGDAERDLLLLPDGHWEQAMIDHVAMALEPLRLLRWVLRVDFFLPPVGATMAADYRLAGSIVKEPELLFRGDKFIGIDDLRIGITAANQWFYRCYAEGLRRELYSSVNEQEAAAAKEYAGKLSGKEGDDMLIGATIVSATKDADVRLATTLGLRRWQILGWVRQRMYGEVEARGRLEAFYLR
jgi:hypothetical protein